MHLRFVIHEAYSLCAFTISDVAVDTNVIL